MKRRLLAIILAAIFAYSPLIWATLNGMWVPSMDTNSNSGAQQQKIDAAAEKYAFVAVMSKTCTLNKAGFLLGPVNVGDTLKFSFQNVDATTGDPDGVVDQYGTVVIGVGDAHEWIDNTTSPALGLITSGGNGAGSGRSVTVGDIVAGVIEYNSWVAGDMEFKSLETGYGTWSPALNVYFTHFTVAWTKFDFTPMFAFGCDDGTYQYAESVAPYTAVTQTLTYNSGSAADEVALRLKVPFVGARLSKARAWTNLGGDAELVLYEGTTIVGGPFTLDKDLRISATRRYAEGQFADVELDMDTEYYVALKPTSGTDLTLNYNNVQSNAILDVVGGGREWYWASRVDGGAWTPLTTRRPFINVMLTFADGSGGGGGGATSFLARWWPKKPQPKM